MLARTASACSATSMAGDHRPAAGGPEHGAQDPQASSSCPPRWARAARRSPGMAVEADIDDRRHPPPAVVPERLREVFDVDHATTRRKVKGRSIIGTGIALWSSWDANPIGASPAPRRSATSPVNTSAPHAGPIDRMGSPELGSDVLTGGSTDGHRHHRKRRADIGSTRSNFAKNVPL